MSITNASSTQKLVTNAWIAFTGTAPSAANYAAHVAFVGTSGAAAYISFLSSHAKTIPAATLASNLLTNLGLSSVFTAAEALAYINSNLNNLGEAITRVSEATLNYVSDSTFSKNAEMLAAKAAYTATATTALTHSSNSANTSSAQAVTPAPSAPVGPAAPDGATIILTTGVDKGAAFVGTAKADTFTAPLLTLNPLDEIDGGAGRDILNATINGNVAATTRISNIEELNFTGLGALTVDTVNMSGVQEFNTVGSTGKMTFTNVGSLTPTFGIAGSGNAAIEITLVDGVASGGADVMKLALENVTAADFKVTAGGIETVDLTVDGTSSSLSVLDVGRKTVIVKGNAASLKYIEGAALDGVTTLLTNQFQGALLGDVIASNGFTTSKIDSSLTGTTVQLGSGNDNIAFVSAINTGTFTGATTNTIDLGGGNNKLEFHNIATNGNTFIVAGSGNDEVRIGHTVAMRTTDVISLGAGNDTVRIANGAANALVLLGVENLILENTALGANTITSANSALNVVAQVSDAGTATLVNIANLTNGSTFTVNNASNETAGAAAISVGYATKQAAATLTLNAKQDGVLTAGNISALTINANEAVASTTDDLVANEAVSITINAEKSYVVGNIGNAADGVSTKLKNVSIVGKDAVTTLLIGAGTTSVLETVSVTGVKDVSVGALAHVQKLTSVNAVSSTGSVTLGAMAATTANTTSATTVNVSAAKGVTLGALNKDTTKFGNVTITATDGALDAGLLVLTAAAVGTISLTSTNGQIDGGAALVNTAQASGIVVNLNAKTFINASGETGGATTAINNEGAIVANISGAALATVSLISDNAAAAAGHVITLNATNTGGSTFIVTNKSTVGGAATSTLSMGNAATGKTNLVTIGGTADNVIVNGGTGVDNVAFDTTNKIKTMSFKLGTGDNAINFAGLGDTTNGSLGSVGGKAGLAINLSNDDHVFLPNTANVTTIKANSVGQFEAGASVKNVITGFSATIDAGTVKTVTGTAQADFIKANNGSGNIITGGAGADTILLGSGADVVVLGGSAAAAVATFVGANSDTITGFKAAGIDLIEIDIARAGGTAGDIDAVGTFTVSGGDTLVDVTGKIAATGTNLYAALAKPTANTAYAIGNAANLFIELEGVTTDGTAAGLAAAIKNGTGTPALGTDNAYLGFIINYTAGGDAQIWLKGADAATTAKEFDAAEVSLVATLVGVAANSLVAADFVVF